MEISVKIVDDWKPLSIIAKSSILDVLSTPHRMINLHLKTFKACVR